MESKKVNNKLKKAVISLEITAFLFAFGMFFEFNCSLTASMFIFTIFEAERNEVYDV